MSDRPGGVRKAVCELPPEQVKGEGGSEALNSKGSLKGGEGSHEDSSHTYAVSASGQGVANSMSEV